MTAPVRIITAAEFAAIFEELVTSQGQTAADGLAQAYSAWQSGRMDTAQFEDLIVRLLATINGYARAGADIIGTTYVGDLTGRQLVPAGVAAVNVDTEFDRLGKAAKTLVAAVDTDADVAMMLDRMARNEPVEAAQRQMLHTYRGMASRGIAATPTPIHASCARGWSRRTWTPRASATSIRRTSRFTVTPAANAHRYPLSERNAHDDRRQHHRGCRPDRHP
ncbi:hypothetical protein LT337_28845 [Mycolicibacterium fortuitum]|nr:hypothetical protein LT337_28845 [Mycolicibacterium fortuitum]